jgi:hypothetical protein
MEPCRICARPTLHLAQKPNHILHVILTVLTAGIWLLVWIAVALHTRDTDSTCTVCGGVDPQVAAAAPTFEPARPPSRAAVGLGRTLGRFFGRIFR